MPLGGEFWPSLVDREAELAYLAERAERGFYRVLHIFGPEGVWQDQAAERANLAAPGQRRLSHRLR